MRVELANWPKSYRDEYGDHIEVPDDQTDLITVMVEEWMLPGNEGTDDGQTVNFVTRDIPIVDGVADWEAMTTP